ncbi:MAG: hypothetical protein FJ215_09915 [Ignavibacteria bacterium]|nr:hypothetical protein [Ignavibacteria bacterium]
MALMTQIRNNLSKLFAVFAVLFILYIMLDWGMDLPSIQFGADADVIGRVNDEKMTYKEFSEVLRQTMETQKTQTGTDPDDDTERQIRDQVWNMLVNQILIRQEIREMGIDVTDKEIIDLVHGPNPPEMLVSQFRDSTGRFNRDAYDQAIADPRNREAWMMVERQLRQQRQYEKLQSYLHAMVRASEGEVRERFINETTTMEAEYVLFDPSLVPDTLVPVTDADSRKYYSANPEEYKHRATRKLKYVLFPTVPSGTDSADVREEMNRILEQVRVGMDFAELAKTYSETPTIEAFFKHGELSRNKENAAFSAKKGEIVGPIFDFDGAHLIKIVDERRGDREYVHASHILFKVEGDQDSDAQLQKARQAVQSLHAGADFAQLARTQSEDPGSASAGGDLGWGGRGSWVKPFEDAAFGARVGDIVGPVKSQFGWHIIKVLGRDNRELKIATISMKLKPSPQTIDQLYSDAQDFAYLAGEEGFERSAELSNFQVRETPEFTKSGFIPGIGINEILMNFAFEKKLNKISDPMTVSGGVAVFKISAVKEEGIRPLEEVKEQVRVRVVRQKKMELLKQEAEEFKRTLQSGDNLLAKGRNLTYATAQSTGLFRPSDAPPAIGRDLNFIGTMLAMTPGEISKPFEGVRGYYVARLTAKTAFDSTKFAQEDSSLRTQILEEKRNRITQDWLTSLRDKAEIEDFRERFFR